MSLDQIPHNQLHKVVAQIDHALHNHREWHRLLVRTLVCKLSADQNDLDPLAYKKCRFGQWYYSCDEEALRQSSEFIAIGKEHKRLHLLTTQILKMLEQGVAIPTFEYDKFSNSLERMQLEMSALKQEIEELIYNRDFLTGAINRLNMLNILREQQELLKRGVYKESSVVMVDLDNFSKINNTYGHLAGDVALKETAQFFINNLRPYDKVFRYGGEEFLLLVQNIDLDDTYELLNRIREGLSNYKIKIKENKILKVTASFGLASLDPSQPVEASIDHADQALYEAKSAGRNCVKLWSKADTGG